MMCDPAHGTQLRIAFQADLPLTGWSVFPLPLATLGALCLPATNPAPPAPAPPTAARARPALTPLLQASCAPADPAPGAASPPVCERMPRPGRFDPATDGPVLYRLITTRFRYRVCHHLNLNIGMSCAGAAGA